MVMLNEMKIEKRQIWIKTFEGISDMVKHVNETEINKDAFKKLDSVNGSKNFTLTNNYEEAKSLLQNGWAQGAEKLTKQLKIESNKVQSREVKRAVYDIVGFQASVPRYLQGIPTNMINKKSVKQKAKVVTLIKDICYFGHVKADKIMEDSVKFIQIVQAIEAAGVRVNVEVFFHSVNDNEEIHIRLPIKKASERLNLSKMSFPLMHPSFLRRMIFRAMETETRCKRTDWCFGYGRPGRKEETAPLKKANEYFIPVLINMDQATDILNQVIATK